MPREARRRSKTGIYHVMLRGANRQEIFHDDEDCIRFLNTLKKYKTNTDMKVYAWCLMNNHVHLLLKEGNESISITMKRIGVSFAQYYHRKYRTTGHLFQDRFKSEHVESKNYLLTVVRYIHQNPTKARMVRKADEWKWSSCLVYYGKQGYDNDWLDCTGILRIFSTDVTNARKKFQEFNERKNKDECLEDQVKTTKLTDDEARGYIKTILGSNQIAQVKSLPRNERNELLRKVKTINGPSQRQIARILGVSSSIVNRA